MGSICPAAPRRVPKLQDPPGIPPLPTALPRSPPLSSLLSSPRAGAFNYSCPPLQTACARWAAAVGFQTSAGWEAPAAFLACQPQRRTRRAAR